MKTIFIFLLWIVPLSSFCQSGVYPINFDDTNNISHLFIDTISNPNNSWQIGQPQKTVFNSAYSVPNTIVTGLNQPYPVNDHSSFIVTVVATPFFPGLHYLIISGLYKVNADSTQDYGKIEFSANNGITWIDLINDTVYQSLINWGNVKPVLTGNSKGWKWFNADLIYLALSLNVQPGDVLKYRFTFTSDSIQDNLDGLMFDNLDFEDGMEGINIEHGKSFTPAYPNPTDKYLFIDIDNPAYKPYSLAVYDKLGRIVFVQNNITDNTVRINTENLIPGLYVYRIDSNKGGKSYNGNFEIIR